MGPGRIYFFTFAVGHRSSDRRTLTPLPGERDFLRFLQLVVGKGESLPADGYCSNRPPLPVLFEVPMPSPIEKHQEMVDDLLSLSNVLLGSQKGLADIGDHLKDEALKRFFLEESLKRASFRGDLEEELHLQGIHDISEAGTVTGKVYRLWADFKARLGASDHSLLDTVEKAEDEVIEAYADALTPERPLPLPVRQMLAEQQAHVLTTHDFIVSRREALAAK